MTKVANPKGELSADGTDLRCPSCGHWGGIDDDQLHGRISVDHTGCPCGCLFHETRDWAITADRVPKER